MCMRSAEIQTVRTHVAAIKDLKVMGISTVQVRVLKFLRTESYTCRKSNPVTFEKNSSTILSLAGIKPSTPLRWWWSSLESTMRF